ncbi:MAG: DUF4080 domain-containing protein [Saccharofermentanales bacterium]
MTAKQPVVLCGLNTRYVHTNLALRSLLAYHRARRPEQQLILTEATINDQPLSVLQTLYRYRAPVYAFSCYIWNITLIRRLSRDLKKLLPDSLIIWGGPEAAQRAEELLHQEPSVDLIIRGEGEEAFSVLLDVLATGTTGKLDSVPGLSWRDPQHDRIHHNPEGPLLAGDAWPFPYNQQTLAENAGRILYYESSRGCPFSCSYCLSALDRRVRYRPLDQTLAELDQFLEADLRQVKFVDRTFNADPARAYAIWKHIIEGDAGRGKTNFHFEVAGDLLDDRSVELLNQAPPGLIQLEIGVQSIHPDVLAAVNRKTNLNRLARQVKALRQGGRVHLHLDLIAGLPGETLDDFGRSFDFVWALESDHFQLGLLKVLPGSPMVDQARSRGFLWQDEPPYEILASDGLSFTDLILLKNIAQLLDSYSNSNFYRHSLYFFADRRGRGWLFWRDLAQWAVDHGWLERPLSPADRALLLISYIRASEPELITGSTGEMILDLFRLDYQLSGQKDQPEILGFAVSDNEWKQKTRLHAQQHFKNRYRRSGRLRIDLLSFDVSRFLKSRELLPGSWAVCFDLSTGRPVLLDKCRVNDLY